MRWLNWLLSHGWLSPGWERVPPSYALEDKKYHARRIGSVMIQLPFSGDIIKGSLVRSIRVEHDKVLVVEDNGTVHECSTETPEDAERVRDNIAHDLELIFNPVWAS